MRTLMHDILAPGGLSILFQPMFEIVNGNPMLYALEALSRGPSNSNVARAEVLFEYIRRKGREVEVDRACASMALTTATRFPGAPAISINVHASTIERDTSFASFVLDRCNELAIDSSRIILEIVEQQRFSDEEAFFSALDTLRRSGVRIALDDIGIGYSNHRTLIEIRPDIYKIDRFFIDGCSSRDHARAAIESIVLLANRLGGRVVAEGIENVEDFETVCSLGIDLVQGYYFSRPQLPDDLMEVAFNPRGGQPRLNDTRQEFCE